MTRRELAVGVGCSLLLVVTLALVVGPGGASGAAAGGTSQTELDPDTTLLDVSLQPDGDAVWRVSYRVRLDDRNTTEAFESITRDIEQDPENYSAAFERRMVRTIRAAANATGREMALRNLSVTARKESLPQPTGVISYRFEWAGFAATDGEQLRAGDAIDQLFLDETTRLSIAWPADYHATSVSPGATRSEGTKVLWTGPRSFDGGQPRVVVAPGTPTPTTGDGAGGGSGGGGGAMQLLLAALVAAVVASAIWLLARRSGFGTPTAAEGGGDRGGPATAGGPGDDEGDAGAGAGDSRGDGPATPPAELLSNEERVLKLVREAGGRMKQKQVAEELDWTAAKTSQVVGTLRDDDELEAFRLGRENVLRLPSEEPLGAPDEDAGESAAEVDGSEDETSGDERGDVS